MAAAVSGFAGWYYAADGNVVVQLVDLAEAPAARAAVQQVLPRHIRGRSVHVPVIETRQVSFSFGQLAEWRMRMVTALSTEPGVTSIDLDEAKNQISIGVQGAMARMIVDSLRTALRIPPLALGVEEQGPVVPAQFGSTISLSSYWRGVLAGTEITPGCTLGFVARHSDGTSVMVTASHCTSTMWGLDPSTVSYCQPYCGYPDGVGGYVGAEWRDPAARSCAYQGPCRNSDVASIGNPYMSDFGWVALPTYGDPDSGSVVRYKFGGIAQITSEYPSPAVGVEINKVGVRTGWTYGYVQRTCVDVKISTPTWPRNGWLKCMSEGNLGVRPNTVHLRMRTE